MNMFHILCAFRIYTYIYTYCNMYVYIYMIYIDLYIKIYLHRLFLHKAYRYIITYIFIFICFYLPSVQRARGGSRYIYVLHPYSVAGNLATCAKFHQDF